MIDLAELAELIIGILTLVVAFGGLAIARQNASIKRLREDVRVVHELTNSRMTELVELVKQASFAAGEQAERDKDQKDQASR